MKLLSLLLFLLVATQPSSGQWFFERAISPPGTPLTQTPLRRALQNTSLLAIGSFIVLHTMAEHRQLPPSRFFCATVFGLHQMMVNFINPKRGQ